MALILYYSPAVVARRVTMLPEERFCVTNFEKKRENGAFRGIGL